jgi:hypothetical protein
VSKKKLAITIICTILVGSVLGVGIFFWVNPKPIGGPDVVLGDKYYLAQMQSGLYYYPDANGLPTDNLIDFIENDASFGTFENEWKTFRIHFEHGTDATDIKFIVQKIKRGNGGLEATITHIYDKKFITYKVVATKTRINLVAASSFEVEVTSLEPTESPKIEIFREDTVILSFARQTPKYLGGA